MFNTQTYYALIEEYTMEKFFIRGLTNEESLKNFERKMIFSYLANMNSEKELFNIYDNEYLKVSVIDKSFFPCGGNPRMKNEKKVAEQRNAIINTTNYRPFWLQIHPLPEDSRNQNSNRKRVNLRYEKLKGDKTLIKLGVLFKDHVESTKHFNE